MCVCQLDCIMQCHPSTSVAAIRHAISSYLKMAPYRQGGAGKGAALVNDDILPGDTSNVESDRADE